MTAPALTLAQLKALRPCADTLDRIAPFMGNKEMTTSELRVAGATMDDIEWIAWELSRNNPDVHRRVRLWRADCAAHVLHLYELNYPQNDWPRNAIKAARLFIRGKITKAEWNAAWDAAMAAMSTAANAASNAASNAAAWDAAKNFAWDRVRAAACDAVWDVPRNIAWDSASAASNAAKSAVAWGFTENSAIDAVNAAANDAARKAAIAEADWQFDRLVMWLSDTEPEDFPLS